VHIPGCLYLLDLLHNLGFIAGPYLYMLVVYPVGMLQGKVLVVQDLKFSQWSVCVDSGCWASGS
jgi:hypothetical protein